MLLKAAVAAEERKKGIVNTAPVQAPAVQPVPKPRFTLQAAPKKRKHRFPPQSGRCQSRFVTIDARQLDRTIVLQCVKAAGHGAGCHYENPGSERSEERRVGRE